MTLGASGIGVDPIPSVACIGVVLHPLQQSNQILRLYQLKEGYDDFLIACSLYVSGRRGLKASH